jgi:sortase A
MDGSATLGTAGVSVIAGHRDTHFRELGKLAIGDRFEIELPDGATYVYEIAEIDVIDAERTMLRLDAEESVVALVTCYPFDAVVPGGSLRYVVMGIRVREEASS